MLRSVLVRPPSARERGVGARPRESLPRTRARACLRVQARAHPCTRPARSALTSGIPQVCGLAATASGFVLAPSAVRPAGQQAVLSHSARSLRREGLQLRMAAATELTGIAKAKQLAGYKAVDDFVKSGMVVGLGTGSTAAFAVERVGQKLKSGELKDIICIPTSVATEKQAKALGIPLCTLNEKSKLDVAIDGADAVDPNLALVKGGGGALLREKMVEVMAEKFICIVDDTKLCKGLGPSFALPVEITPFCHEHTLRTIAALPEVAGCTATIRMGQVSTGAKKDGDNIAVTGAPLALYLLSR
jgi:ribose 5-phosphate isomerase A